MEIVTVSPKFQVMIPQTIVSRSAYGQVRRCRSSPMKTAKARGFLKGIDTTIQREPDRTRMLLILPAGWRTLPTTGMRISLPQQ
jgi:hypothetical protein